MKKLIIPYNELVRVSTDPEYNVVGDSKIPLLKAGVLPYFSGDADLDPFWINLALWGDLAEKFESKLKKGQIARVNSNLTITVDGEKAYFQISVNNGYQFTLFPSSIKGEYKNNDDNLPF